MKKLIMVILILMVFVTGCSTPEPQEKKERTEQPASQESSLKEIIEKDEVLSLGSTFVFDDLEITVGDSYSFTTIENEFADHNGADVIKVPVKVKNLKDETHSLNMFYIKIFGAKGTTLDSVDTYFDDDIGWSGDLRPEAEMEVSFNFLYDEDGTYYIELDNFAQKLEIEINVTK